MERYDQYEDFDLVLCVMLALNQLYQKQRYLYSNDCYWDTCGHQYVNSLTDFLWH